MRKVSMMPERPGEEDDLSSVLEDEHRLDWRIHQSYSDWKLTVFLEDKDISDVAAGTVYNLHRAVVAFGPRRCSYFTALFEFTEHSEPASKTSTIVLCKQMAKVVPLLLDFVYNLPSFDEDLSSEDATALHSLGDFMGNRPLKLAVEAFMKEELGNENPAHIYYKHAKILGNDDVIDVVLRWYVDFIYSLDFFITIEEHKHMFQLLDASFWVKVVKEMFKQKDNHTEDYDFVSKVLIAAICENVPTMTANEFQTITSEQYLEEVGFYEVFFMKAEEKFDEEENGDGLQPHLSILQRRCALSLPVTWNVHGQDEKIADYFRRRPFLRDVPEFVFFRDLNVWN